MGATSADTRPAAEEAARRVLGRKFGIVRDCFDLPPDEVWAGLHVAVARGTLRMPSWRFPAVANGTGVSLDAKTARLAAVAEAVERYCAMAPSDPSLLVRASYRDVHTVAACPPQSWALLSDDQYRLLPTLEPLTEGKVIDWCWAFSLVRRRAELVPAALVYCDPGGRSPNNFLPELPSSGFACHVSIPAAVQAGVFEVLERDALTIAWTNRLPLTPLDPAGTPVADLLEGPLSQQNVDFRLYLVPTDAPFKVVLAVGWGENSPPFAAVGAACRANPIEAAMKALFEAVQMILRFRRLRPPKPTRIREFADHAALYGTEEGAQVLRKNLVINPAGARLLAELPWTPVQRFSESLLELTAVGLDPLVVEVTTADVARAGFRVVRVLIPETLDMTSDSRFPRLGGKRLYQLPVRLGLRRTPLLEADLNRLPVPLA